MSSEFVVATWWNNAKNPTSTLEIFINRLLIFASGLHLEEKLSENGEKDSKLRKTPLGSLSNTSK